MGKDNDRGSPYPITWLVGLLVTLLGGVQGYIVNEVSSQRHQQHTLEIRITAIESSRFTRADGKELAIAILELERRLSKFPTETPPKWLKDLVEENKERIDELYKQHNHRNSISKGTPYR